MADNTTLDAGSGGDVIATDDIGGVKHQLVKAEFGAADSATQVSHTDPFPVEGGDAEDAAVTMNPVLAGGRYDATDRALDDGDAGAVALDPNGALLVSNHSIISPTSGGNSSTTPLGSSATFTGTGEQNEHPDVGVSCKTDNTGTLYFDFSNDGTNWDTFPTAGFTLASGIHEFHTAVKLGRYFRVRLVNDAGAQSYLRLYTYYGTFAGKPNAPIGVTLNDDSDATTTHAVITGKTSGGAYENVGITTGGNLKIVVEEIAEQTPDMNSGVVGVGTQRVVLPTDQPALDVSAATVTVAQTNDTSYVDDAAGFTLGTSRGQAIMGFAGAQTVDSGDMAVLACNTSGVMHVNVNSQTADLAVDLGANNDVQGQSAHDAATSGNPFIAAGEAQACDDTAPPNRVSAEGDTTQIATDFDGAQFVRPHGPQLWDYHVDGSSALTDASVHAAPGAGLSLYVTDIIISLGAATALNVFFEESTTTVLGPYYLEAVNGRSMHLRLATPKKITANTALTVTSSAAVAHSIDVMGYTAQG